MHVLVFENLVHFISRLNTCTRHMYRYVANPLYPHPDFLKHHDILGMGNYLYNIHLQVY